MRTSSLFGRLLFVGLLLCSTSLPAAWAFQPPPIARIHGTKTTTTWQRRIARGWLSGGTSITRRSRCFFSSILLATTNDNVTAAQKKKKKIVDELNGLLKDIDLSSFIKTCKVEIGPSSKHGWGIIATQDLQAGESALKISIGGNSDTTTTWEISKATALTVFGDYLPAAYDSWTGEVGLMALQLLNERARHSTSGTAGIPPPRQRSSSSNKQQEQQKEKKRDRLKELWLALLPTTDNEYPLLWNEDDQEILQSSTTNKIYRRLDDLEEDFNWLDVNVFGKDRATFPATVVVDGDDTVLPCFSLLGFKWAMSMVQSRSFFLDGALRLIPIIDFINHDDDGLEVGASSTGIFGSGKDKAASVSTAQAVKKGNEVSVSYGPVSAAEYLLDYGFVPPMCWIDPVVEISVEMDSTDRFYDDKLDILEFETYGPAPMDPVQKFELHINEKKHGPIPDPALLQFLRLRALGQYDAFLLESVFRKEAWGFMALPVSEANEQAVVDYLLEICHTALDEFAACPTTTTKTTTTGTAADLCRQLRAAESTVLERLVTILEQEKQGLHLKEYYQERRLKDLGLDSVWTPEDDLDTTDATTLSYGQTRAPGGADYDW
jgi:[ribulose-bisphosphate carboxylase]/[fructose-bisphosphate aldolase]-lysine N-methyltransferase